MRFLTIAPLSCLLAGCWTPGPDQLDPTLYRWHPRNKLAAAAAAPHPRIVARGLVAPDPSWEAEAGHVQGNYCMMSLEPQGTAGITVGGGSAAIMPCYVSPNQAPR